MQPQPLMSQQMSFPNTTTPTVSATVIPVQSPSPFAMGASPFSLGNMQVATPPISTQPSPSPFTSTSSPFSWQHNDTMSDTFGPATTNSTNQQQPRKASLSSAQPSTSSPFALGPQSAFPSQSSDQFGFGATPIANASTEPEWVPYNGFLF